MDEEAFRRQALEAIERFVGEDDPAFRRSTALSPHAFELAFGPDAPAGPLELDAPAWAGRSACGARSTGWTS